MKTINSILILSVAGCILFGGCSKDPSEPPTPPPAPAAITTTPAVSITLTSAVSGGNITNNGGDSVIERGICYGTAQNPTVQNQKIRVGSGNGSFSATITNLTPASVYHIRAYAINSAGTAYGNDELLNTYTSGRICKILDSASALVYDTFEYNSNKQLVRFRASAGGGSPNNGYTDTFVYNNNLLVRSQYNLGQFINYASPYAKTDYFFQGSQLTNSDYYLGNTNLITQSVYSFDGQGRVIQITQKQINGGVGSYPTYTTRFEYDANSNLTKVFYRESPYAEYMRKEYLNYDNKDNPFYKLPWKFDYNVFEENTDVLSKNNVGVINNYSSFQGSTPFLNGTTSYSYEYNADGKVSKRKGPSGTKYIIYKYE